MSSIKGVENYIILTPDPRLRQYWPEADYDTSKETLDRMLEMSARGANDGRSLAGLSSVQVTLPGRVVTGKQDGGWVGLIDPIVVERSYYTEVQNEGCFSLQKGRFWPVRRPVSCIVEHTTENGREKLELRGITARFTMHEIDHINGILITDYQ